MSRKISAAIDHLVLHRQRHGIYIPLKLHVVPPGNRFPGPLYSAKKPSSDSDPIVSAFKSSSVSVIVLGDSLAKIVMHINDLPDINVRPSSV